MRSCDMVLLSYSRSSNKITPQTLETFKTNFAAVKFWAAIFSILWWGLARRMVEILQLGPVTYFVSVVMTFHDLLRPLPAFWRNIKFTNGTPLCSRLLWRMMVKLGCVRTFSKVWLPGGGTCISVQGVPFKFLILTLHHCATCVQFVCNMCVCVCVIRSFVALCFLSDCQTALGWLRLRAIIAMVCASFTRRPSEGIFTDLWKFSAVHFTTLGQTTIW